MEIFIFDYAKDAGFVDSFLETAALSHGEDKKSNDWFFWKFRDNPFGESVLACAKENGIIVGCVAMGMLDFNYESKLLKGAISFETFVHPNQQGKGLFKKLITVAEQNAAIAA
ncbi:GNAT family N-acetyltransferase [Flavobacterium sp. 3HN19-14]|uniref:GNAT family N-acetyltransferase n=1 Tax=Flavobacterium sp. 3HN19-14 TaxID=3448133 RepID=UPI003EDF75CE